MNTFLLYNITHIAPKMSSLRRSIIVNGRSYSGIISYARISSKAQEGNSSIATQHTLNSKHCAEGGNVIDEFYDEVHSVAKPVIPPLLSDIVANAKNIVVMIWTVDRFSRNYETAIEGIKSLVSNGCCLIFVNEKLHFDAYSFDHVKITLCELLKHADHSSKILSDRIKASKQCSKDNGVFVGGLAPFGKTAYVDFLTKKRVLIDDVREQNIMTLASMLKEKDTTIEAVQLMLISIDIADYNSYFRDNGQEDLTKALPLSNVRIAGIFNELQVFKRGTGQWTADYIGKLLKRKREQILSSTQTASHDPADRLEYKAMDM